MLALISVGAAAEIAGDQGMHRRAVVLDPDHAAVEVDRAPLAADLVARCFPHLARSQTGILEAVDERLDHPTPGTVPAAEEGIPDRAEETQSLDPLRRPLRRDGVRRHPPDLLGVGLEEDLEQEPAE